MASLLAPKPSAIMRRRTRLADFRLIAGVSLAVSISGPVPRACGAALPDSTLIGTPAAAAESLAAAESPPAAESPAAAGQDSTESEERWLPVPEEDLESTEALEEEGSSSRTSALLRGTVARGRFAVKRIGFVGLRRGIRCDLGFLREESRVKPGIRLASERGGLALAGGRVSVSRAPSLFAEAMRITRAGRRVLAPRSGVSAAAPSLGASAGAIDGGAAILNGVVSAWCFAGIRGDSREPIGSIGLGVSRGETRVSAAIGAAGDARCGSITVLRRERGRSLALEALGSSVGRALLAEVASRADGMLVKARWRYRSWAARSVAAEISAETLGSGPRARLTWRSWSGGAAADDGLLELEGTMSRRGGGVPVRARLGAVGIGSDGNHAPAREAYGMIDATLARDAGRSLTVHAVRRASSRAGSRLTSTTVGARLDVSAGWIGEHSMLIETTRLRSGAAAWGVDLTPSGETVLRARSKPGMRLAGRGTFGARAVRLGYALERSEDSGGPRPWSGSVWLRLDR